MLSRSAAGGSTSLPTHPVLLPGMGRVGLGQSPGAVHDGAGGTWPRRRSSCGIAHASTRFLDDLFVGLFESRMKIKNDSKKSRWDLGRHGFWSKKSIRELLSLLLLRHGMV